MQKQAKPLYQYDFVLYNVKAITYKRKATANILEGLYEEGNFTYFGHAADLYGYACTAGICGSLSGSGTRLRETEEEKERVIHYISKYKKEARRD